MKKIAHEAPLSIATQIREKTDYDYALVHLFENEQYGKEYLKFFDDSLKMGREVILDNSAYELGDSFDFTKFRSWIYRLCPTYYIIPDCPGNYHETMSRGSMWIANYRMSDTVLGVKTIGVVQGSTYEKIVDCYNFWKEKGVDKIAFTFYYPFYEDNKLDDNRFISLMKNRQVLIDKLLKDGIIDTSKKHHLLGCWLPQEFEHYKNGFDWIDSIDTSNPVLHGIEGEKYGKDGILHKSAIKMESLMFKPAKEFKNNMKIIGDNIDIFKKFVN